MFNVFILSKAAANPFNFSASAPSKFQFYICFQSFQPDFLSVFHGEDTVSPNMWNKVNELSRENLPQQQIVTSSFHQCQQCSTSSQCQCHNSNILVNANPSHPTPIRNRPTLLCHFATKTVPAKRSKRYKPHQNAHFAPTKSFYRYEIANPTHPTTLPQKIQKSISLHIFSPPKSHNHTTLNP